jgi:hypothetical protein
MASPGQGNVKRKALRGTSGFDERLPTNASANGFWGAMGLEGGSSDTGVRRQPQPRKEAGDGGTSPDGAEGVTAPAAALY